MTDPQTTPTTDAEKDDARLEHSVDGVTTRDDALDAGVPMIQGKPNEPIGPEDAMGPGPKRGDYAGRIDQGPHLATERIPESERGDAFIYTDPETGKQVKEGTKGAVRVPVERPHTRLVSADERVGDVGDQPGKGGVSTPAAREALGTPPAV